MFIASRAAADRIFRAVHEAGFDDVTIAQSRLMMGLDTEGTRLSVLAERAQIAKQTATALVDKLERAGYVERVPTLRREGPTGADDSRAEAALPIARRGGTHRGRVARSARRRAHGPAPGRTDRAA